MRTIRTSLLTGILLLLLQVGTIATEIIGRVVAVHDGDTITVLTPNKFEVRIRLHGIDAPELSQAFGNAAKRELSKTVFGKQARVVEHGADQYQRTLGQVYVGTTWVNEAQVSTGLAWVYRQYSDEPRLIAAEATARQLRHGLWKDKQPVPPWEWRRSHPRNP